MSEWTMAADGSYSRSGPNGSTWRVGPIPGRSRWWGASRCEQGSTWFTVDGPDRIVGEHYRGHPRLKQGRPLRAKSAKAMMARIDVLIGGVR